MLESWLLALTARSNICNVFYMDIHIIIIRNVYDSIAHTVFTWYRIFCIYARLRDIVFPVYERIGCSSYSWYVYIFHRNRILVISVNLYFIRLGIGADEAFIFIKIWRCTTEERIRNSGGGPTLSSPSTSYSDSTHRETLNSLMATTLKHAAVSMLVSSLTTAAAFYASYMTQITAIKCYG